MLLAGVAALLAGVITFLATGPLLERRTVAGSVIPIVAMVAVAVLVARDSAARGRSGWRWVAACALLFPLGFLAFAVIAVYDRLHGRRGIEARWDPAGRWYLLGGLALTAAAVALAVSQVHVPGVSVSAPGASGSFSGSCSSALSVSVGGGMYNGPSYLGADAPAVLTAAWAMEAGRCSVAAANRLTESGICLGGAVLLALAGQGMNCRRRRQQTLALP